MLPPFCQNPFRRGELRCVLVSNRTATIQAERTEKVESLMPTGGEFGIDDFGGRKCHSQ
ncbi:hypothetical protein GCM10010277_68690 [Streptomyces longisporoflavus]|nr:hypothetical protein GCM10010277_68690 [Streptomyces longisporoflavus]